MADPPPARLRHRLLSTGGWAIPCLLVVACDAPPRPAQPPLVEGAPLGSAGAHEHGVARLGIAVDGARITVDLRIPAESVYGFEHAPRSEAERAAASVAVDGLRAGATGLLTLSDGTICRLDAMELDAPEGIEEAHGDDGSGHSHEGEGEPHGHGEVHLRASLDCPRAPSGPATLHLGELLPEVQAVDLTVITAAGEAAARVPPDVSFHF